MKRVFVTGANRGIGLEFTRQYLQKGDTVFAASRNTSPALQLLKEQYENQLVLIPLDITDSAQIEAAAAAVQQETDTLELLINNAGVLYPSRALNDIAPDTLAQTFAVNAIAPINVIQQFYGLVSAGKNSKIVNITMPTFSIAKVMTVRNHGYVASRYALNAMTRLLALEMTNVIIVALWPGYIRTNMNNMASDATPPEEAIPVAVRTIEQLTMQDHGHCILPDGAHYDW